jgi:hypothetical protein
VGLSLADPTRPLATMNHRKSSVVVVESEHHDNVLRVTDTTMRKMSVANPEILAITLEAKQGTDNKKSMTLRQSFPLYKKKLWHGPFSSPLPLSWKTTTLPFLEASTPFQSSLRSTESSLTTMPRHLISSLPLGKLVSPTVPCAVRFLVYMLLELSWTNLDIAIP